jgi:putative Holliday junction resolvase
MQGSPHKTKPKRIIGVDYGLKRIGLSISDDRQIIASPIEVMEAEKKNGKTVIKLINLIAEFEIRYNCEIEEIVIGLPLMMSGKHGFLADEVNHFVDLLAAASPIPIRLWDERLSTVQAERALRESEMTRKKRSKVVDRVSAAIILQSYLDRKAIGKEQEASQDHGTR